MNKDTQLLKEEPVSAVPRVDVEKVSYNTTQTKNGKKSHKKINNSRKTPRGVQKNFVNQSIKENYDKAIEIAKQENEKESAKPIIAVGSTIPINDFERPPPVIIFRKKGEPDKENKNSITKIWYETTWNSLNTLSKQYVNTAYKTSSCFSLSVGRMLLDIFIMKGFIEYSPTILSSMTLIINQAQECVTSVPSAKISVYNKIATMKMSDPELKDRLNTKAHLDENDITYFKKNVKKYEFEGMEFICDHEIVKNNTHLVKYICVPCSTKETRMRFFKELKDAESPLFILTREFNRSMTHLVCQNYILILEMVFYVYGLILKITDILIVEYAKVIDEDKELKDLSESTKKVILNNTISKHLAICCKDFLDWIQIEKELNALLLQEVCSSIKNTFLCNKSYIAYQIATDPEKEKVAIAQKKVMLASDEARKTILNMINSTNERKKKEEEAKKRKTMMDNTRSAETVVITSESKVMTVRGDGTFVTEDTEESSIGKNCVIS